MSNRRNLVCLILLAGVLTVVAPAVASATAVHTRTAPCWKRLLNDWYDGTINNIYPIPCYSQAIQHLPTEVTIYGSAKEDILAARQAALNHMTPPAEQGTTNSTTIVAVASGSPSPPNSSHGITRLLDKLTPGDTQSFPLPLLILGGLAILLVAAGAAGMVWQRSHPRDEPPAA